MIEAYLTLSAIVILIGIVLMFLEGGGSSIKEEPKRTYTEKEIFDMQHWPFAQIFHKLGIKTWKERKEKFKKGKKPRWYDKISLWMEGNENR